MPHEERTNVEFRAGPLNESDVVVHRIVGSEGLSQPYGFDIDFFPASGDEVELADLCGTEALISMRRAEEPKRYVHGVLSSVRMTEVLNGKPRYQATLVPTLWRLRHVQNSRIFQDMAVTDIVKAVLDDGGVKQRWDLSGDYPTLPYCVQYRETDFDFVSRLLEDAGIFYFFEHEPDGHTQVLVDSVSSAASGTPPTVPYRREILAADKRDEEYLVRLAQARGVRPTKVALKDFDFERPALAIAGESAQAAASLDLEWYEYPGGFTDSSVGKNVAQVRLEEWQFGMQTFEGEGNCMTFAPGGAFEVSEHPDDGFDKTLFLVRLEHEATHQEGSGEVSEIAHTYSNKFVALDSEAPYRPRRRTPRPQAYPTTATVVGAAGEEIFTDSKAQVKVQFHWDRQGKNDDKSSCWIRCAQVWGGPGWGANYLPRIGQEVLIKFLDGDPDRPILAGATYNGENQPPLTLPDDKTQSTLRSDSSPGGKGSNEFRFEDQAGSEELTLHAQKDETIEVLADKQQRVGTNESISVGKDLSIQVHGNQDLTVDRDDTSTITQNQTLLVTGARDTLVQGNHSETVGRAQSVVVAGNLSVNVTAVKQESVGGAHSVTVGGAHSVVVAGLMNQVIGGVFSQTVAGTRDEVVGLNQSESVGQGSQLAMKGDFTADIAGQVLHITAKDHQEEVKGKFACAVTGAATWQGKKLQLKADKLTIVVGGSPILSIDDSGNLSFSANKFAVTASSDLVLKAGGNVILNDSASGADGSANVSKLQPIKGDKASVSIAVKDQDGNPVANEWFRAEFPDGTVREGQTDGSGKATAYGPKPGNVKVSLPRRDKGSLG